MLSGPDPLRLTNQGSFLPTENSMTAATGELQPIKSSCGTSLVIVFKGAAHSHRFQTHGIGLGFKAGAVATLKILVAPFDRIHVFMRTGIQRR